MKQAISKYYSQSDNLVQETNILILVSFINELQYFHANTLSRDAKNRINWLLISSDKRCGIGKAENNESIIEDRNEYWTLMFSKYPVLCY